MKKSVSILCCLFVVLVFTFSAFGNSKTKNVLVSTPSGGSVKNILEKDTKKFATKLKLNSSNLSTAKIKCVVSSSRRGWFSCAGAIVNFLGAVRDGAAACQSIIITQACNNAVDHVIATMESLANECEFLIDDEAVLLKKNKLKESLLGLLHSKPDYNLTAR